MLALQIEYALEMFVRTWWTGAKGDAPPVKYAPLKVIHYDADGSVHSLHLSTDATNETNATNNTNETNATNAADCPP